MSLSEGATFCVGDSFICHDPLLRSAQRLARDASDLRRIRKRRNQRVAWEISQVSHQIYVRVEEIKSIKYK